MTTDAAPADNDPVSRSLCCGTLATSLTPPAGDERRPSSKETERSAKPNALSLLMVVSNCDRWPSLSLASRRQPPLRFALAPSRRSVSAVCGFRLAGEKPLTTVFHHDRQGLLPSSLRSLGRRTLAFSHAARQDGRRPFPPKKRGIRLCRMPRFFLPWYQAVTDAFTTLCGGRRLERRARSGD
jgi:hypothetical protein